MQTKPANLRTINKTMHSHLSEYVEARYIKKKHVIYQNGTKANGFYYVESGLIGLYQISENGKETLLRIYGPGSFFGYRSLFTQQQYPSTARAMIESKIEKIRLHNFDELNHVAPKLAGYLVQEVCTELGESEKRLLQYNLFNSPKRIIDAIHFLFSQYPTYSWTYREIGEYSGTDTTTVLRICKKLKEVNLLDNHSRKPSPTDLSALADFRRTLTKI